MYAAAAADVLGVRSLYLQNKVDANGNEIKPLAPPAPRPERPAEESWIAKNDNWI